MKICFLLNDMSVNGGVQRVLFRIANALSDENEICIFAFMDPGKEPYYKYPENIKIIKLGKYTADKSLTAKVIRKLCRKYGLVLSEKKVINSFYGRDNILKIENLLEEKNFDAVVALQGTLSILLGQVDRKKIKATKLFGWVHNSFEAYFETKNSYCYGEKFIAKSYLKNLDGVITLTAHDAKRYQNELNARAICIYNPLSFEPLSIKVSREKHLIWVGRLNRTQKGLDYLTGILKQIFANQELGNWDCMIAGDGPDAGWLRTEIEKSGLSDKVKLLGNRDDMPELYARSSILLSTSRWEGFGLTVTEAFASGVPVVAFENSGPKEIIQNGENGFLVSKYDTGAFSDAVIDLMKNDEKRQLFSKNALVRAKDFEIENIKNQWMGLLKEGIKQ